MVEQTYDRVSSEAIPSAGVAPTQSMLCPVCGFENIMGADECANCGSDLRTSDIPQATSPFEHMLVDIPLASLRTRPPFTADASAPVAEILRRMRDEETADILVVDGGQLVGIFTERDAALKLVGVAAEGRDLRTLPVSEVMTHDPVVLRGTDSIAVAVQKMAVGGFRHIPLVRDGAPIGVISAADVFRHILHFVE